MSRPVIDLSGKKIGALTVIGRDHSAKSGGGICSRWICKCRCGRIKSFLRVSLLNERRKGVVEKSCGCLWSEEIKKRNTKHGMYGTPTYWSLIGNKKRAVKLRAIPKWYDQEKVKQIYKNRPTGFDVDHIVPLVSKYVCGLHWHGNLQYLTKKDNQSKKNRFWPDMPMEAA